jgi:hypothetical protein
MGKGARSHGPRGRGTVRSGADQYRSAGELAPGRWPEIRLIRKPDLKNVDGEALRSRWNTFLSNLGDRNYGKGSAVALGSSALVFASAQEMGRMLEAKYPHAYEDRKRTVRLHTRFAEEYSGFLRKDNQARMNAQLERIDRARAQTMEPDFADDDEIVIQGVELDSDSILWNATRFGVSGMRPFSKDVFGLDLSDNDQLLEEYDETVTYLRREGLNTNLMNRHPETSAMLYLPHLRVFETLGHISSVSLVYDEDMPWSIDLAAPMALATR